VPKNPPAFDQILIDNYETLERAVDPRWLPLPVLVASRAAKIIEMRKEHLSRAESYADWYRQQGKYAEASAYLEQTQKESEAEITKMLKKKQWRQGFTEYGSGHYGTIYPTQIKGIVCKITTDASEARFVANALSIGKFPRGIVKYYHVISLKRKYKNRPVYALWREEVQPPTLADAPEKPDTKIFTEILHSAKLVGAEIRQTILRANSNGLYPRIAKAVDMADHGDQPEYLTPDFTTLERSQQTLNWIKKLNGYRVSSNRWDLPNARRGSVPRLEHKLSVLFYAFRTCAQNMHMSYAFAPGAALEFYQNHDMILADVHSSNVMREIDGDDDWLISDPGHMVELSNRYAHVKITEI
jgi:hypothetical protein